MLNLVTLIKINFLNSFKIRRMMQKGKGRLLLYILIGLYIMVSILSSLGFYYQQFFNILNDTNITSLFIPMILIFGTGISFVMTIYNAKNGLFDNKDNDLLLSLPIKSNLILISRLLSLMLYNLVIMLIILLPGIFIYVYHVDVNILFYVYILIVIFVMPIIPTILSSLVGYLLAYLSSKMHLKSSFEFIYYIVFMGLYFYLITNMNRIIGYITTDPIKMLKIMKYALFPFYAINEIFNNNSFLYLLYLILFCTCLAGLFIFLLQRGYYRLLTSIATRKTKHNYQMQELKLSTPKKALIIKEIKKYFSVPIYVFNTGFGPIMLIIFGVATFFYTPEKIMAMANMGELEIFNPPLIIFMVLTFITALTNSSCISISLEKNNFWIIKTSPINIKDIFDAKLFVNYLLVIPMTFITLILVVINSYVTPLEALLLFVYTIFLNLAISNFGLIGNLLFPKLDSNNDVEIVKRSASVMLGTIIPMFVVIALLAVLVSSNVVINITFLSISIFISFLLFIICRMIILKWGIRRFKEIS